MNPGFAEKLVKTERAAGKTDKQIIRFLIGVCNTLKQELIGSYKGWLRTSEVLLKIKHRLNSKKKAGRRIGGGDFDGFREVKDEPTS